MPNTTFHLDFYANEVRDPSGQGEGQFYLGALTVTTDGQGHVTFEADLPAAPGPWSSATATREGIADTSEFSPGVGRQGQEFGINNTNSRYSAVITPWVPHASYTPAKPERPPATLAGQLAGRSTKRRDW